MSIRLEGKDVALSLIAQGARVDGARLPSGLKVPVTPGMKWIIVGRFAKCIKDEVETSNVPSEFSE